MLNINKTQSPAFKGVYQFNAKVDDKNINEVKARAELEMAMVLNAQRYGGELPKFSTDSSLLFKIDDKHDADFEKNFKDKIENCNKTFNVDLANKAYLKKSTMDEYNKATSC